MGSKEVWTGIFRCKYNYTRSIPQRKSIIFRSLCMANMVCDKGKGWLIKNGHSINFWHDNWLGLGTLREKISRPLNLHEESLKLCDLWDANNNWCLENISCSLPSSLLQIIQAIPRPLIPNQEDYIFWHPSRNGQFTSTWAYKIALDLGDSKSYTGNWDWIWKLNTLPRISSFLWLACHERLPTKTVLFRRKITQDDNCTLCKTALESTLHISSGLPLRSTVVAHIWNGLSNPIFFFLNCQRLGKMLVPHFATNFNSTPTLEGNLPHKVLDNLVHSKKSCIRRAWVQSSADFSPREIPSNWSSFFITTIEG